MNMKETKNVSTTSRQLLRGLAPLLLVLGMALPFVAVAEAAETTATETRTFIGASSNNFPPINVLDDDGELTGFGQELSDAVIEAIGGEITHIHSNIWTNVLKWLDEGKADFIHDTGYAPDRTSYLDYSDPIIEMPEEALSGDRLRPDQASKKPLNCGVQGLLCGDKSPLETRWWENQYTERQPERL